MWKIFQVGLGLITSTNDTLMMPSLVLEAFISMNLMEPDYNKHLLHNCQVIFQKLILFDYLMIHRHCCEQFHVDTFLLLQNYCVGGQH